MEYVMGTGLALGTAAFASFSGFDRDRVFYPAVLVVIALYYDLFAVMGGGDALGLEAAMTAVFAAASVIGFRTNLWIVAAGLLAHGLFDLVHGGLVHNPAVPGWWPAFCMSFDISAGAWLAWLLGTSRIRAQGEPGFGARIRPHVQAELLAASTAEAAGDPDSGFRHLERAHVLGQASTIEHVRVHSRMLGWALRRRRPDEITGQILRIMGAATKTSVGLIPMGNTGGANVSPFKPLPIPDDLAATIARARMITGVLVSVVLAIGALSGPVPQADITAARTSRPAALHEASLHPAPAGLASRPGSHRGRAQWTSLQSSIPA